MFDTPTAANLSDHAIEDGLPHRWPATLARLVDVVNNELAGDYPCPIRRYEISTKIVVALSVQCGGKDMYLPRGDSLRVALSHAHTWRLSADYGWSDYRLSEYLHISERGVRKIIAEQRALRMPKKQPDLFGLPNGQTDPLFSANLELVPAA